MEAASSEIDAGAVERLGYALRTNVGRALEVRDEVVEQVLVALLARGHTLIEDRPGVGKTALARAFARSIRADFSRIQCTADLLPADVVGAMVFNQRESRFEFHPGPLFANVVLVDEINRASPKTQSGLLEAMQEGDVTVDGQTHELAGPFLIVATQNPIEFAGTYPLPEAQLDRFMTRVELGYPSAREEAEMLGSHAAGDLVDELTPVAELDEILAAQRTVASIHVSEGVRRYVVALAQATRDDRRVELGASPRGALMLLRAAMARAALRGRDHALPDDVKALAAPVLAHRLLVAPGSQAEERAGDHRRRARVDAGALSPARGPAASLHRRARRGAARRRAPLRGAVPDRPRGGAHRARAAAAAARQGAGGRRPGDPDGDPGADRGGRGLRPRGASHRRPPAGAGRASRRRRPVP